MAAKRRRLRGKTTDVIEPYVDALRAEDLQLERELTAVAEEVYDFATSRSAGEVGIDLEAGLELGRRTSTTTRTAA